MFLAWYRNREEGVKETRPSPQRFSLFLNLEKLSIFREGWLLERDL